MVKLEILEDDDLRDILTRCISGLLPHENFESGYYLSILDMVNRYIKLEEMEMEFYAMFKILHQYGKLKNSFTTDYEPILTREILYNYLVTGTASLIDDDKTKIKKFLRDNGLEYALEVPANYDAACKILSERVISLYDTAFDLELSSAQVISEEPILKQAFLNHVSTININTQRDILLSEVKVGRKSYSGCNDWLDYINRTLVEISQRLSDSEESQAVELDNPDTAQNLLNELREFQIPIANYEIPEIDDYTPILRHRLVVVVGKENVGKTKFAVDQAVNVIRAGKKVVFMCGETHKAKMFADILINYIWKEFHVAIDTDDIVNTEQLSQTHPEIAVKVLGAIDMLTNSKNLILRDSFTYDHVYEELEQLYEATSFDAVFIDHSCALIGTAGDGSLKAKVDALTEACKNFRKKFPVYIMVTSHPSTTAKKSDSDGKDTSDSPTKGSQTLSTDADEVFYLRDNPTLYKQGLVILENTKRRNAARLQDYVYLRKRFSVSTFEWREEDQNKAEQLSMEEQAVLQELESFTASPYI